MHMDKIIIEKENCSIALSRSIELFANDFKLYENDIETYANVFKPFTTLLFLQPFILKKKNV